MVRHPRGSYIGYTQSCLWKWSHQKTNQFIPRCHDPYARKFASPAVCSRMHLTLHATRPAPHDASRLVQEMSAWSGRPLRAPSRHCRDARVYGHTTTVMHGMNTPPPFLSLSTGQPGQETLLIIRREQGLKVRATHAPLRNRTDAMCQVRTLRSPKT